MVIGPLAASAAPTLARGVRDACLRRSLPESYALSSGDRRGALSLPLRRVNDPRKGIGALTALLGRYAVRSHIDAFSVRRAVRDHAGDVGFPRIAREELALVTSELCTNIVKYGVEGSLAAERVDDRVHGPALVLVAEDVGPPFHDFATAVRDGRSDRGTIPPESLYKRSGIGAGLGAVARMTHGLWLEPLARGKRVVAARYVVPPKRI